MIQSIKFQRLHPDAVLPRYAHGEDEDAGMDLVSVERVVLEVANPQLVKVGWAIEMPPGMEAQIRPRSGLALKQGITVYNSPGTVDPGYRGELGAILWWMPTEAQWEDYQEQYIVEPGQRIAQIVFAKYEKVLPAEHAEHWGLSETYRGTGGLGSTG